MMNRFRAEGKESENRRFLFEQIRNYTIPLWTGLSISFYTVQLYYISRGRCRSQTKWFRRRELRRGRDPVPVNMNPDPQPWLPVANLLRPNLKKTMNIFWNPLSSLCRGSQTRYIRLFPPQPWKDSLSRSNMIKLNQNFAWLNNFCTEKWLFWFSEFSMR